MARSESPGEKKKGKKKKRSESPRKKTKKKRSSSSEAKPKEDPEAARSGPKLAFRFAERGKEAATGDGKADGFLQSAKRRRPKEEELRRRSFTVEELAALAQLAGSGLQAVRAQATDGQGVALLLTCALSPARKLGLAEKVLLKAILEPAEPDQPLHIGPELIQALGLVPKQRTGPEVASTSEVPPPPPSSAPGPNFTSPPPPPAAPTDPGISLLKRTVPLEEWPQPSTDAVQQMLARFPQLDGHCRGSLMNLPPQYALAILWDMDAKGGPEEIRDPQGFVFSATQTLLQLPGLGVGAAVPVPQAMAPPLVQAPLPGVFVR